jgi:uncharacterized SAM-binding protein YcdF (DUF218 family)
MDTNLVWRLLEPSHLLAYTAVLGVVLGRRALGRRLLLAAAVLLIVLGLLPTAWLLMTPLEQRFSIPADPGRVDGIIVLAGAESAALSKLYGQPQLDAAADRLTMFLMLARRFPDARLVHSGDTVRESQSAVARELLLGAGIDPARIVFETKSRNTCGSPRATLELVRPEPAERWLLVTSAYHMPRSVACFRAAGWDVTPYPTDFRRGPSPFFFSSVTDNLEEVDYAAHEWVGLLYYRLRGFTNELFPRPR